MATHEDQLNMHLFHISMKSSILLSFISRSIPDFTDHGPNHTNRIKNNVLKIIDILEKYCDTNINYHEKFLLNASAYLHDIGNLVERVNHAKISVNLIFKYKREIVGNLNDDNIELICDIISTHSKSGDDEDLINELDEYLIVNDNPIKPKLLAALFRLADALDLDSRKASMLLYSIFEFDKINTNSGEEKIIAKNYWNSHQNIMGINLSPEKNVIDISVKNLKTAKLSLCHFCDDFYSVLNILRNNPSKPFPCSKIVINWRKENKKINMNYVKKFTLDNTSCKILSRIPDADIATYCPIMAFYNK